MLSTSDNWRVCDDFLGTPVGDKFSSLDRAYACEGELITRDLVSQVKRVTFQGKRYYVKIYNAAGKRARRYFGRSRVRAEWENLMIFQTLGIATADIVAYGQETNHGLYKRGALVTAEVENSVDLENYVRNYPGITKNKDWLNSILAQIADYARKMHDVGFAHSDLNWRNILVSTQAPPRIKFIDCPSGRFWPRHFLKRKITRDLAHLDKVARELLSKTDRLRFYMLYMRRPRLSEEDKLYIPMILSLHDKHRERKQRKLEAWQKRRAQQKACAGTAKGQGGRDSSGNGHRA
ncbi:MAG: lipopolysaccharide kinase InaA family protein [Pseudomonadota bacterium]